MSDEIPLSRRLEEMAPPVWKLKTQAKCCVVAERCGNQELPTVREPARVFGVTVIRVVRAQPVGMDNRLTPTTTENKNVIKG